VLAEGYYYLSCSPRQASVVMPRLDEANLDPRLMDKFAEYRIYPDLGRYLRAISVTDNVFRGMRPKERRQSAMKQSEMQQSAVQPPETKQPDMGRINTDDLPILEFEIARSRGRGEPAHDPVVANPTAFGIDGLGHEQARLFSVRSRVFGVVHRPLFETYYLDRLRRRSGSALPSRGGGR